MIPVSSQTQPQQLYAYGLQADVFYMADCLLSARGLCVCVAISS
jgi:hypothetical protein